ncbi:MAG: shikimate kinase [Desulfovibrionaceae bacterium]|nr:shikimate kinase [Desulfovibrionaceae bacterium]
MSGKRVFIKKKFEVTEPDKVEVSKLGDPAALRPDMPGPELVFLIGLDGSGKSELGALLAQRLGVDFKHFSGGPEDVPELLEKGRAVVAVAESAALDPKTLALARDAGRVFYLMADVDFLAGRLAADRDQDLEARRRDLAHRLWRAEPVFMAALHFVLRADAGLEDAVQEVLDKLAL